MKARVSHIEHVQISAPEGCEVAAREYYGPILGLEEIEKPRPLRHRGGCWFRRADQQVHIGVERNFQPDKKAHPALAVSDLHNLRETLSDQGYVVIEDDSIPEAHRLYSEDCWGNRIEFVEAK